MSRSSLWVYRERMARPGLITRTGESATDAVGLSAGIQAQDVGAARLAVRSRTTGLRGSDVDAEALDGVVRTWLMRGTLHWVAGQDVSWLLGLFGPMVLRKYASVRAARGITDELIDASEPILRAALAPGARTASELVELLTAAGVAVPVGDNAAAHLFIALSCRGVLVRGSDLGRRPTYALLADHLKDAQPRPSGIEAIRELMTRYLRSFAPATAEDAAAWSGLPVSTLRPVLADVAASIGHLDAAGSPLLRTDEPPDVPDGASVRLLAGFDTYLMGYRHRAGWLAADHARRVAVGGILHPSVCVDGRLVGRWRLGATSGLVQIQILPGHRAPPVRALQSEVADVGRFLDRDLTLGDVTELT